VSLKVGKDDQQQYTRREHQEAGICQNSSLWGVPGNSTVINHSKYVVQQPRDIHVRMVDLKDF